MENTINILKELVIHLAGKNTERIIDILVNKKDVSEFKIADKLEITVNQARNILYKLNAHSIISFIRKKDRQKGWFIYYYTLNISKALAKFVSLKEKYIENLKHQLSSRESKNYFSCESCGIELNEETALLCDFLCQECGTLLKSSSKTLKIEDMKEVIKNALRELDFAKEELAKIRAKEEKKKMKEIKKKLKEKAEERARKRAEKAKEKKKLMKQEEKAKKLKKKPKAKKPKKKVKVKKKVKIKPSKSSTKKKVKKKK